MRSRTRPNLTGQRHTLGVSFLAAAYVLAVEQLSDDRLDLIGISPEDQQEAVRRVVEAIARSCTDLRLGVAPDFHLPCCSGRRGVSARPKGCHQVSEGQPARHDR